MRRDENMAPGHSSSSRLIFREARLQDDRQICAQIRRTSMPGRISMTTDYEPSFFEAVEVEGYAHRVVVAERDHQIVGVGLMCQHGVFLNGAPGEVGYIGGLRADKSVRGMTTLFRGNQMMKLWDKEHFNVPFYLSAILEDNVEARRVLYSGRAGLPQTREIGILYNAAIPFVPRRRPRLPDGVGVVRGTSVGAEGIAEFLNRVGKEKQFYPVYTAQDILAERGILRGLGLDDFYIAVKGDVILGVIACWNQLSFRRTLITGYSGILRPIRPVASALAGLLRMAPIPSPGDALKNVFASCVAVAGNDRRIFKLLLDSILYDRRRDGNSMLVAGVMEKDPLLPVLRGYLHIPARSCIYMISWKGFDGLSGLDERVPYVEIAGL